MILEANLTAATLLGIDRGTLLAQPLTRFVLPGDREVWQRHARQVFESGELLAWEMRLSGAEGKPFWALVEAMVRPEVVSGQSVCRLALSDITERRRVEAALQESEERYRVIVESSRDLIFFLDQSGRLRWCNQAARELFGGAPRTPISSAASTRDDAARLAAAWRSAREGEGGPAKISYRLRAADGGYRTLESIFRKISFAGETLWCVVATDMTELTRLRRKVSAQQGIAGMVGRDPAMLELNESIRELAGEDVPVLILGESGTGKELIAAAIHREGPRAAKNFVAINCGALPGHAAGDRALRPREGVVHRRAPRQEGPLRTGGRRVDLPRRGGRPQPRDAGQAPARPAGGDVREGRRRNIVQGGRAGDQRHQQGPEAGGRGQAFPGGPLLPAQRRPPRRFPRCASG